jgi:hypothetical protein
VLSNLDASGAESVVKAVWSAGAEDKQAEVKLPCAGVARKPCSRPVASN